MLFEEGAKSSGSRTRLKHGRLPQADAEGIDKSEDRFLF